MTSANLSVPGYDLQPELRRDRADTATAIKGVGGGLLVHVRHGLPVLATKKAGLISAWFIDPQIVP